MLGADLLVNPVTEPGADHLVDLPARGDWVDVWTGETHAGGHFVERPVPIREVPVYCSSTAWPKLRIVFQV